MLVIHVISTEDTKIFKTLYTAIGDDCKVLINPSKKDAKRAIIEEKDCVMLIGHGTEYGLLNERLNGFLVGPDMVQFLRGKTVIGIWCYAGNFAQRYDLKGFFTSNFISNVDELLDCGFSSFEDAEDHISIENFKFSAKVNEFLRNKVSLNEWVDKLQESVKDTQYPFVKYNYEALYYNND